MGAGSAGLCAGQPAVGRPGVPVALLEAGGTDRAREIRIPVAFTKLLQTGYDWNYRTTGQSQLSERELYWPPRPSSSRQRPRDDAPPTVSSNIT